jgi:DNA processing protein
MVTSFPDGLPPERWTFPVRNRWIAGLASALVVVEAPLQSGALITAAEAAGIGRPIFAVPGQLGAPQSAGCLQLLVDGAELVDDVERFAQKFGSVGREPPDVVLEAMGLVCSVDDLAVRLSWPVADVLRHLSRLEVQGRVVRSGGQRYLRAGGVS